MTKQQITLTDKRKLGYEQGGKPDGKPLFYFHGVPSAAAEWHLWGRDAMLERLGVRLIAIDRPGVGGSSFQPGRRLTDWPADVIALADALGIDRFSVLGYSGGSPYAAVCALKIPQRLNKVGIVSGVAPFDLPGMTEGLPQGNVQFLHLAIDKPFLFQVIYWQIGLLGKLAPAQYLKRALSTFDTADRSAFSRQEVHQPIFSATGSPRGEQLDTRLIIGPWDFCLDDITMPVLYWRGGQDRNASSAMGRYITQTIPNCQAFLLPDEGHISLIVNHAEEIITILVG